MEHWDALTWVGVIIIGIAVIALPAIGWYNSKGKEYHHE